ncbi:MAG: tyrosine-type recombinase/integrase, partial [Phycisphaerae bacterium]|nr:tyrosine-type recombinase/integrase [Phycisphaerae bacterium]NIW95562.1 tyrosine-type recombinase/integrase [Phycisphaerae bacterium]
HHTLKTYLNKLRQFVLWVDVPIEHVNYQKIIAYIDYLLAKRLRPETINCHLKSIRRFYSYLRDEKQIAISNPVKTGCKLRTSQPLPKHLKDEEVLRFFEMIKSNRDRAMFMLMLRCGLRVEEVANLSLAAIDWRRSRLYVFNGKGQKDRVVYISRDTYGALAAYIKQRLSLRVKKVFLVQKGTHKGKPLSVRGIQKRMEYYAKKAGLPISCHQLRHTMATQLLNADADLVSIQDLLGHSRIKTTQRYCRVSNLKVQRDYFKAIEEVIKRTTMNNNFT